MASKAPCVPVRPSKKPALSSSWTSSASVRTAMVAGLVALGAAEGGDAYAQAPQANPPAAPSGDARRPARKTAHARALVRTGLVATLPGFEMLPDGGSRLFVELTKNATVTEKREGRTLSYVIQGARVDHRNNENALVTVHFNTPVTRARLLPVRGNVVFSVELRADTPSTWRMAQGTDGEGSVLQVDFPRGAFLAPGEFDPTSLGPPLAPGDIAMTPGAQPASQPAPAPPPATQPAGPATNP